uniref:Uncharacterized protein n=1 Tax=Lotharella vacuolata TaxID=74820 RepID=A0A0H5BH47_9EUKA|nr:hypothetical protein [Lotharella vacuolata]
MVIKTYLKKIYIFIFSTYNKKSFYMLKNINYISNIFQHIKLMYIFVTICNHLL